MGLLSATGGWGPYDLTALAPPESFDSPPVVNWSIRLPGPRLSSATHTEPGQPLIYGGEIFVGSAREDALVVIDRTNGTVLRRYPASAPVHGAPVVSGEQIYFADSGGATWCYDLDNVDQSRWRHDSGAPILSPVTLDGGRVFVANVDNSVYALEAQTGALVWRHGHRLDPAREVELSLYGAPAPVPHDDTVIVGFSDGALLALRADDGTPVWSRRVGEGLYPDIIAAPVVRGEEIIASGFMEPMIALDSEHQMVRWRHDFGGPSRAVESGGRIAHGGGDGVLRAIDSVTGDVIWEWDSKTESALTSPVMTSAGWLVGAAAGTVSLIDGEDGTLLWHYDPGYFLAGVSSAPAVDGHQAVVLTNAGNLISFVVPVER